MLSFLLGNCPQINKSPRHICRLGKWGLHQKYKWCRAHEAAKGTFYCFLKGENSLRMSSFEVWINLSLCWRSYRLCWCKFDCITNIHAASSLRREVKLWYQEQWISSSVCLHSRSPRWESYQSTVLRWAETHHHQFECMLWRMLLGWWHTLCHRGCQKWNCSLNWYTNVKSDAHFYIKILQES
jgi:hypothetical protein